MYKKLNWEIIVSMERNLGLEKIKQIIFMHVSFIKGGGDLKINVLAVPG